MYICNMKIANIVSNNNISVSEEFNVVKSIDEIIDRLPTLIIGFDYVNKHYPDFNILDIELEPPLLNKYAESNIPVISITLETSQSPILSSNNCAA